MSCFVQELKSVIKKEKRKQPYNTTTSKKDGQTGGKIIEF